MGLPGWFNIHYLFFVLPLPPFTLPYLSCLTLLPWTLVFIVSLYEDGLLTRRRVFFLGNFAFMYFPSLITYTR